VLLVWLVWLTFEYIGIGSASVIYFADNAESFIPPLLSRKFSGQDNPLWDRFTAADNDHMALGYQVPIVRYIFDVFPGWLAHGFVISVNYVAAVIATYALSRRTLSLSRPAGAFAAIFYSVSIPPQLMATAAAFCRCLFSPSVSFSSTPAGHSGRWAWLSASC